MKRTCEVFRKCSNWRISFKRRKLLVRKCTYLKNGLWVAKSATDKFK